MSASKHTPGPWTIGGDDGAIWIQSPVSSDNVICDLVGRDADCLAVEDEANARLIAAAPELLAALKAVDLVWERQNLPTNAVHGPDCLGDDEHEAWGLVITAIAKAEGRS